METLYKQQEKNLRTINSTEKILKSVKRVNVFSGADLVSKLKDQNISKEQILELVKYMLLNNIIFKVEVKKKNCDILLDYRFTEKDFYIWSEEKTSSYSLLFCLIIVLIGLCIVMFQMWPSKLRFLASYFSYVCGAFIAFLLILGVLRLIIFCITYFTHSPGIWLFPNLFAECGFVDSFRPLWAYHGVVTLNKEKDD